MPISPKGVVAGVATAALLILGIDATTTALAGGSAHDSNGQALRLASQPVAATKLASRARHTITYRAGWRGQTVTPAGLWSTPVDPGLYEVTFNAMLWDQTAQGPANFVCGVLDLDDVRHRRPDDLRRRVGAVPGRYQRRSAGGRVRCCHRPGAGRVDPGCGVLPRHGHVPVLQAAERQLHADRLAGEAGRLAARARPTAAVRHEPLRHDRLNEAGAGAAWTAPAVRLTGRAARGTLPNCVRNTDRR